MRPAKLRRVLQTGAFFRKESLDVLRQPLLLLTLVLGPFVIMAIFGIGYRETPESLKTLFVAPEGSPFAERVEEFAGEIGDYVEYAGLTSDAVDAERRLLDDDVDVVITFPDQPLETVLGGDRASVTVTHTRLDPIEQTAISFAARLGVDEINSQVLAGIVQGGQDFAEPADVVFAAAESAVGTVETAFAASDPDQLGSALDDLAFQSDRLALSIDVAASLSEQFVGDSESMADLQGPLGEMSTRVEELRADPESITIDDVTAVRSLLTTIDDNYAQFTSVDPEVLVRPFESTVEVAVDGSGKVTDWYAPAAVILMLQQFGVAFGALSFVRERQLGIVDVYRVAPVNAFEALLGKYLSYLVIGGAIGGALLALVVGVLDVPVAGSVGDLALVVGLTLFASIGLGFVISLVSSSDAQAVQYTMILLLASLFFSGFFLALGQLEGLAEYVSYLLPVSYGMQMLRDVMLRGSSPDTEVAVALGVYGVIAFGLALIGARRHMGSVTKKAQSA